MTVHPLVFTSLEVIEKVRVTRPLIHNISNYVAMDISANALLAAGASPAMIHAEEEVQDFVRISSALVVNIGTLSAAWVRSMEIAVKEALANDIPWVLDPVGAGATPWRTEICHKLAEKSPKVIRANASEVMALAMGKTPVGGVDSTDDSHDAVGAARALARRHGTVVAMTGATDYVTDGDRTISIDNGHPVMAKITASGCTVSALVAAACAVHDNALEAVTGALAWASIAGEMAAEKSSAPGSFRVHFIDAISSLGADDIMHYARIAG